jgi:hypothetical protein
MPNFIYELKNTVRDLTDVTSTLIAGAPRFISQFPVVADATNPKHEWLEDQIAGRNITALTASDGTLTVTEADAAKLKVGTQLSIVGDTALFKVAAISGTNVTVSLLATNGSKTTTPKAEDVLEIVSTPTPIGSTEGEYVFNQSGSDYNCTQIFRKDVKIPGTLLATRTYGLENTIDRQVQIALQEMVRDMNRVALKGTRVMPTSANDIGMAGGLYFFGTQEGGLSIALDSPTKLTTKIVNDGAESIIGAGGTPSLVLCGLGQARVLSAEMKDQIQVVQTDTRRGAYVAQVINDVTGAGMTIIGEPDMPDTEAFVLDPAGFGLSYLSGRGVKDEDTTPNGFDGIRRTIIAEATFEFKNAKQRICRISNLTASNTALA